MSISRATQEALITMFEARAIDNNLRLDIVNEMAIQKDLVFRMSKHGSKPLIRAKIKQNKEEVIEIEMELYPRVFESADPEYIQIPNGLIRYIKTTINDPDLSKSVDLLLSNLNHIIDNKLVEFMHLTDE